MRQMSSLRRDSGFTLIEMIVVTLLLAIAMLGLLAVFDASARINKNETDVADAQGAVRYGVYQMTRVIRMAGSGGLFVTQAVLNHADAGMDGVLPRGNSYDNAAGGLTVQPTNGPNYAVRPGTDMIEIRGVINSPLIGFDDQSGCNPCTGSVSVNVLPITGNGLIGQHVNNDPAKRPQFAAIDAYTATAPAHPMFVLVEEAKNDLHTSCADGAVGVSRYPQMAYNVGVITAQTQLVSSNTFGPVDFGGTLGPRFNTELPSGSSEPAIPIHTVRRAGILDDIIFFVAPDPAINAPADAVNHPALWQGTRRGAVFEVERLADDVEDMQIAYGVDADDNGSVTRDPGCGLTADDPDPNFSTTDGCDEWVPNGAGEGPLDDFQFQSQDPFASGHTATQGRHCPRLHGVMISLLAKSRDPDPTYHGPYAKGYKLMNSTATPITGNFRRRVQTLKINLRNYSNQG